jgi:microcystin-dependent protein
MNHTKISKILIMFFAVIFCCGIVSFAKLLSTAFTYQGRLIDNNPANGFYDLKFRLYDSPSGPNQINGEVICPNTPVDDGYFTVELDFGNVFDGNDRCLEIDVRRDNEPDYTTLSPRQKVTPTPYAIYAKTIGLIPPSIPSGVIVMWSGSIASIPSGWVLCNGTNGTPDLRERFIVGAGGNNPGVPGSGYAVGATGGEVTHTLTIAEMPSHTHQYTAGNSFSDDVDDNGDGGRCWHEATLATQPTGGNQPHENRPPYYALAYIMKL